ncbi:RING-type domain-containing protein [Abeliophyllum distichum]|uniref:RING-type domain-containing protein n=1 Tax=Abeliophyllum distichum TaxID=126358 RepID=A0ABD1P9B4_9LAMI
MKRVVLFFQYKSTKNEVFYDVTEQEIQNHELVVSSYCSWNPTSIASQVNIVHKCQSKVIEVGSSHYKSSSAQEFCSKTPSENLYREGFPEELDMVWFSNQEIGKKFDISSHNSLELNLHVVGFNHELEDPDQINSSNVDSTNSSATELHIDDNLSSSFSCSNSFVALEQWLTNKSADEKVDSFYHAIVHSSWNKMERKMLARSLESDLELIYVAQMCLCLSWEALHYQYRKVESIINSQNEALFHNCTARDFQIFQVLLERFIEDEKCEGKRYSNFIHKRLSFKTLLQVPDVTVLDEILSPLFAMISENLFRPLPPPNTSIICILPDDDDLVATPTAAWPHLQLVDDILLRLIITLETNTLKDHIDRSFIICSTFSSQKIQEKEKA